VNLKEQIKADYRETFLNSEEFATSATFVRGGVEKEVKILYTTDTEVQGFTPEGMLYISASILDIPEVDIGDIFKIDNKTYAVTTFVKKSYKVEIVAGEIQENDN